ncbi:MULTISPECIES: hypothetical protein [unclassified Nostoc]|uniref:hypothetical protein n=1 Tax=unclassified Nostoc TaxID=2593658 RepID=UPI0018807BD2|nr:hypothetical protein [Nostoc sp. LEGE 12450]MBE8988075.1 hypothetical protein [Nostoc sp. LEGE 12450]
MSDEKVLRGAASLAILSLVARISILGMTTARSHNRPSRAIAPTTAATIAYSPFNLLTWLFAHSPHLRGLFLILGGS